MEISYQIILIGAGLLIASILAANLSSRIGMPILLVFLFIGMLVGEEGPGAVNFQNIQEAHLIGVLALAVILFDAGLHTKMRDFKIGLKPAILLSSVGIVITCIIVGLFAAYILHLPILEGFLLGAILAPTDAAAVFSLLHNSAINLKSHVTSTLEIESGSNDPIAVLLAISIIEALQAEHAGWIFILGKSIVIKIILGLIIGIAAGYITVYFNNRIKLIRGLSPLLILASGMLVFSGTELLGGSGYLAVYLTGIVIGNSKAHQLENTLYIHDSLAWLSQIIMFLMLGLLITPSSLLPTMLPALAISIVLIFIARPLAVFFSLLPFKFSWQEQVFISWVGLRGAVPIILALNPLMLDLKHANLYFNIVFFIVLISLTLQGWSLATVARTLGLTTK